MATRIEKILQMARITLADPNKERWTDETLLLLLSEGHKDLCRHTKVLNKRAQIDVRSGEAFITLPDDCWMVTRVQWGNKTLKPTTYARLDRQDSDWQLDTGSPEAYIYDRRGLTELRLYPEPDDSIYDVVYTFAGGATYVGGEVFGVTASIDDYTFDSDFGVVTDLFDPTISTDILADDYGVITDIQQTNNSLKVFYIASPLDITSTADELQTHHMFDTALKYYVVGQAFLNDIDTAWQEKGTQQLAFYTRELTIANETNTLDAVRDAAHQTEYRRGV